MKTVAFDTETRGLNWFDEDERAFLATWADEAGEYKADLSDEAQVGQFHDQIKAAQVIAGHNLKFDIHQARETLGIDVLELGAELHDTDLMSRVLHPEGQNKSRSGHGLKENAKVYLRADAADDEEAIKAMGKSIGLRTIKQKGAYYDIWRAYPEVMEQYALMDARFTYDLLEKWAPQLGDLKRIYDMEMKVLPVLVRAEARGVATDQEAVRELKQRFTQELQVVHEYLARELGEQALGGEGSDEALIEALLKHGIPLYQKTDTGKLATNKFALQEFEKDFELIAKLFEHRRLERFLTTYIGAVDGRDVVHCNFGQCSAWTGRMSCRSPNLQNLPKRAGKEVRAVFAPRPGHAFVVSDYESIEPRLLAYYLGDAGYKALIAEGRDPYAYAAVRVWGGEMGDYLKGTSGEPRRSLVKAIQLAISYGAGARRVAAMLRDVDYECDDIDIEAKRIISAVKAALPGYYKLMKRIRDKIERVGYVNTIMGRKNPVNKEKSYVGMNALIQGSAADIMKQGLVNVDAAVTPLGGIPLLVVHDEVVTECPIEVAEQVRDAQERAMIAAWNLDPPLSVESSIVTTSYTDA